MEMNTTLYDETMKKSIFSSFPMERLNILHPVHPRSLELTELQATILHAVNESLVTTAMLLQTRLVHMGITDCPIEQLRKELKKLGDAGYLTKMEFCTSESRSLTKVFALSNPGKEFIRSCGIHPIRTRYVSTLDAVHCKKLLSTHQFLNSQGWELDAEVGRMIIEDVPMGENTRNLFRTHAVVQQEDKTVFIESVRAVPGAMDDLLGKLKRMDRTLALKDRLNIPPASQVEVLLCCENYAHMEEIIRGLISSRLGFGFTLKFTNDYDTFHNPESCIYVHRGNRKSLASRALGAAAGIWGWLAG